MVMFVCVSVPGVRQIPGSPAGNSFCSAPVCEHVCVPCVCAYILSVCVCVCVCQGRRLTGGSTAPDLRTCGCDCVGRHRGKKGRSG